MELDNLKSLKSVFASLRFELILAFMGLALVLIGIFSFFGSSNNSSDIEIIPASESAQVSSFAIVDVSGSVTKPGVYKLNSESRIGDAIQASGGFSVEADNEYIAKNLNLAARLKDGMKIYIPKKGEAVSSNNSAGLVASLSTINLNSASQSELESLPGVGPVTAGKIIAARPFNSVDELIGRKVVGKSVYEKIKDSVSVF